MEYYHNLSENDYYDSEKEVYVLTLDENCIISSNLSIKDCELWWNCYLVSAKYNKKTNTYTAIYKEY